MLEICPLDGEEVKCEAEEMVQSLRTHTSVAEDPSSVCSIYFKCLLMSETIAARYPATQVSMSVMHSCIQTHRCNTYA